MITLRIRTKISVLVALLLVAAAVDASAACLTPAGDITNNNTTNVIDVQCLTLVSLWYLNGSTGVQPICLQTSVSDADINCDGNINVSDVQLVILLALKQPLPVALDADADKCVDVCEADIDGDGDPDSSDCAPYVASVFHGAIEACNGYDDDCDGSIDELHAGLHATCDDQNVCTGTESCVGLPPGLGLMISEIMKDPTGITDANGEWFELFNPTSQPIDINGWTIQDAGTDTHVINNGGPLIVPAGGYLILGSNADPLLNGNVPVAYQYSFFFLANADDEIILKDLGGAIIDQVFYDNGPTFPDPVGASMALKSPAADNNLGASWSTSFLNGKRRDAETRRRRVFMK